MQQHLTSLIAIANTVPMWIAMVRLPRKMCYFLILQFSPDHHRTVSGIAAADGHQRLEAEYL